MSIDLDLVWFTLSLRIPCAVELSVQIGVDCCLCPSSFGVLISGMACFAFMKRAAISASAALEHAFLMILAVAEMDPFSLVPFALERW